MLISETQILKKSVLQCHLEVICKISYVQLRQLGKDGITDGKLEKWIEMME